jgi:hypothetical protein
VGFGKQAIDEVTPNEARPARDNHSPVMSWHAGKYSGTPQGVRCHSVARWLRDPEGAAGRVMTICTIGVCR